jgi:hypothetical protein
MVDELNKAGARYLIVGAHALAVHGVARASADLAREDVVAQIGVPPYRIDLLTGISGVKFDDAWGARVEEMFEGVESQFIGRADLVRNKRASGRLRDRADLESLGESAD